MPQPLFLEVTDYHHRQTRIVGLAHISDILRTDDEGGGNAAIVTDKGTIATVETYDEIRAALCADRVMAYDPPFTIKAYAGGKHPGGAQPGAMVLHTWHRSEASRDAEIAAFKSRIARGEISHIEVIDHAAGKTETIYSGG